MFRTPCLLSFAVLFASCGVELVAGAHAESCACGESGTPTEAEVFAKVEALSVRDIDRIEKAQAEERRARAGETERSRPWAATDVAAVDSTKSTPAAYRVIVSLGSAGSAAHSPSVAKLDDLISDLERRIGRKIDRRILADSSHSPASDLRVCMPLAEIDGAQQQAFVSELKSTLSRLDQVQVEENAYCGRRVQPQHPENLR
jgi:hypothetical protein